MTDEHTAGGGEKQKTVSNPGGGPKRVVSDKSVDDILSSLNAVDTPADAEDDHEDDTHTSPSPSSETDDEVQEPATDTGPDEALSERIEQGTVTGADVRAAESRGDPTPEIDDIDLRLEDLEATQAGSKTQSADSEETDGPLAGTITPAASEDSEESSETTTETETSGIIGRLTSLFSRSE